MKPRATNTIRFITGLMIILFLLTSCLGQAETLPSHSSTVTPATEPAGETGTEAPAKTPSMTNTPPPPSLFLSDELPEGIVDRTALAPFPLSDDPGTTLWFGPTAEAPVGEELQSSLWVYALAAPFPTLTDAVTLSDLQTFWQGNPEGALASVKTLYIPETVASNWQGRWGEPAIPTIVISDDLPAADTLWAENAWAVLPFEALTPKLKVIQVDGISPLIKDFSNDDYPLIFEFQLILNENSQQTLTETDRQSLINAFTPTNRDPEKMTTLVMTGVTALVRATAYRMEINGVLYPGEEIVDWLSEANLTHISNEVSFYEDCPFPNPHSRLLFFCSNPEYIELFDYVGADIIELTGNHNNDSLFVYGVDVVPFTLDLYQQRGMVYYGGGLDLADAMSPLLVTHNGNRLAFIGCNASGPDYAWATETQSGAAPCGDYQWMADEISRLRSEGYLPIATYQFYEDYYNFAEEHHIRDFGLMAEAGAVIVNGSQAHRPKGMAFEHDAFIDYGLGNLFFDQMGYTDMYGNNLVQVRWEIIQRHTFYDGKHLSTELLTAMLEDYAQPRPMTDKERLLFLEELFTASGWNSR